MYNLFKDWIQEKRTVRWLKKINTISGKPDVILHVGPPKSGTSVIQKYCVKNRGFLQKRGYFYPPHPIDANGVSSGHARYYKGLLKHSDEPAEWFAKHLETAQRQNHTLLLSSELFWPALEGLMPLIENTNYAVIALFRHPADRIVSAYNQAVKRSYCTTDLNSYIKKMASHRLNQTVLLEKWLNTIDQNRIVAAPYEKSVLLKIGLPRVFLHILNIPAPKSMKQDKPGLMNGSYLSEYVEIKRRLNLVLNRSEKRLNTNIDRVFQKASDAYHSRDRHTQNRQIVQLDAETRQILDAEIAVFMNILSGIMPTLPESELTFDTNCEIGYSSMEAALQKLSFDDLSEYIRNCIRHAMDEPMSSSEEMAMITDLVRLFSVNSA